VVKLLWLAIINIEDKRARLVVGQRVTGWREALNELDTAYPGHLR
jgi:putative transposase